MQSACPPEVKEFKRGGTCGSVAAGTEGDYKYVIGILKYMWIWPTQAASTATPGGPRRRAAN